MVLADGGVVLPACRPPSVVLQWWGGMVGPACRSPSVGRSPSCWPFCAASQLGIACLGCGGGVGLGGHPCCGGSGGELVN